MCLDYNTNSIVLNFLSEIERISFNLLFIFFFFLNDDIKIFAFFFSPSFLLVRSSPRGYLLGAMLIPPFTRHKLDSRLQSRGSFDRTERFSPFPPRFIAMAAVNRKRPPAS